MTRVSADQVVVTIWRLSRKRKLTDGSPPSSHITYFTYFGRTFYELWVESELGGSYGLNPIWGKQLFPTCVFTFIL